MWNISKRFAQRFTRRPGWRWATLCMSSNDIIADGAGIACGERRHSRLKTATCEELFINVLKPFSTPRRLRTFSSCSVTSGVAQDVRWETVQVCALVTFSPLSLSNTHTHTYTDQFFHSETTVTAPAAEQMSLHMDKAGERRQLRSH